MATASQKEASARRRAKNRALGEARPYRRVRARPIHPGTRVKITRRCLERRMFLSTGRTPEEIENFYGYTLGRSLDNYGMQLHAGCQMDNHHHVDVTDVRGERPAFKDSLHGNLACGLNAKRGRSDRFWSGGGSCDTCQPTDDETLEDLAYTDANPVEAGLVKWGDRWPGFTTYGWKFGETRTFKRPDWYYDPKNPKNPPFVKITRVRPNIFPELSDDELWELLQQRIHAREIAKQAQMREEGRRFMGEKKIAKQHWNKQATSWEKRFTITPKVAASDPLKLKAQLQRDRDWERWYAEARDQVGPGNDPLFPPGTYWLRIHCRVRVAQGPP